MTPKADHNQPMNAARLLLLACCSAAALLCAVLATTSGCAPRQVVTTYVLDAQAPPRTPRAAAPRWILLVAEPRAEAGCDTPRMAYTKTPLALEYYTQSAWVDTPARLLTPLLVDALERSRGFDVVLPTPTSVDGNIRLETTLIRLQQEFQPQPPSRARLTVRVKLIDIATNHVLGTELLEVVEVAPSEDAYGGVQAANRAVQRLLQNIQAFTLRYAPEKDRFGEALPGTGTPLPEPVGNRPAAPPPRAAVAAPPPVRTTVKTRPVVAPSPAADPGDHQTPLGGRPIPRRGAGGAAAAMKVATQLQDAGDSLNEGT